MIINVPYFYEMEVKLPRRGHPTTIQIADVHPVAFEQVDSPELVARILSETPKRADQEIVHHDGDFWTTLNVLAHASSVTEDAAKQALEAPKRHPSFRLFEGERHHGIPYYEDASEVVIREVLSSAKDETIRAIERAARDFIVVDGLVRRRMAEPVLEVRLESAGEGYRLEVQCVPVPETLSHPSSYWRLDDYDRMNASYQELFANYDLEPTRLPRPEVHRPDLLEWNREREMLWAALDDELGRFVKNDMPEAKKESLVAYADLRDLLRNGDRKSNGQAKEAYLLARTIRDAETNPASLDRVPFESCVRLGQDLSEDVPDLSGLRL